MDKPKALVRMNLRGELTMATRLRHLGIALLLLSLIPVSASATFHHPALAHPLTTSRSDFHHHESTTSGWTLQPTPLSNDSDGFKRLSKISCPTVRLCYAVGGRGPNTEPTTGIVIQTQDGGQTWTTLLDYANLPLDDIACPSTTTCFAIGNSTTPSPSQPSSIILSTTDSGRTWVTQPSYSSLESISCPLTSTCYITHGTAPTSNGPIYDETIAATTDGADWQDQRLPPNNDDPTKVLGILSSIACPSLMVCYATGPGQSNASLAPVVTTTDGGHTWTLQPGGGGDSISCPSVTVCYTVMVKHRFRGRQAIKVSIPRPFQVRIRRRIGTFIL